MSLRMINPPFDQRRIPPLVIYLLTEPQFQAYRRPILISLKVRRDDSELLGVPQVDVGRPAQSWVDVIDGRVGQDVLYPAEFVQTRGNGRRWDDPDGRVLGSRLRGDVDTGGVVRVEI